MPGTGWHRQVTAALKVTQGNAEDPAETEDHEHAGAPGSRMGAFPQQQSSTAWVWAMKVNAGTHVGQDRAELDSAVSKGARKLRELARARLT